jgi:hypothetical protein
LAIGVVVTAGIGYVLGVHRAGGSLQAVQERRRVDLSRFGARGDGRSDDTAAFQAAHDSLGGGGVIAVGPGTYRVSRVNITNRGVEVELAPGAVVRKLGEAGVPARGIFVIENLLNAAFVLRGGRVDLNGEGPMGIGQPDRLRNLYAPQTIPSVGAIAGPANAAVFALASSHVTIAGVTIENSGESGILLRNCSDTLVDGCTFRNLANYGVEWSMPGGRGTAAMPDCSRNHVKACHFEDIDDYGLGSGNGVGVGGGGSGAGWMRDYSITDCTFLRCLSDINFEFTSGSGVAGIELARLRSQDARKAGFGLVGVRDAIISDYIIINPGYAPSSALGPNWPSIHGGSLSSDFSSVRLDRVQIIDRRRSIVRMGTGGEIARGARLFHTRDARFSESDVGTFLGIRGANPQGVCYSGRVVRLVSPNEVELDLPAGASVQGAAFAYGGACREGLRLFHGESVQLRNCRVEAGTHSGLPGEPAAAAIRIENVRDAVPIDGTVVLAPPTAGTTPVGIDLIGSSLAGPTQVTGFARNLAQRP